MSSGERAGLAERIAAATWTSHNVELDAERSTMPGRPGFFATDTRLAAVRRILRARLGADLSGRRVADLGCLEGGFAIGLALDGAEVVGIEARHTNIAKAELLRDWFGLDRVHFVQDDVKSFETASYGTFDAVLALGILYHLDRPAAWLRRLAATTSLLVIDTHVAPPTDELLDLLRPDIRSLSRLEAELCAGSAYEGRWYSEFAAEIDDTSRQAQAWASWSNHRSFWLTESALLRAIRDAGFDLVLQQHDATIDHGDHYRTTFSRGMYVGIRTAPTDAAPC